jgi:hypothetical protein
MVYSLCQAQLSNEYTHIAINERIHLYIVMYRCGSACINLTLASARIKPIYSGTLAYSLSHGPFPHDTDIGPFWSLPR